MKLTKDSSKNMNSKYNYKFNNGIDLKLKLKENTMNSQV